MLWIHKQIQDIEQGPQSLLDTAKHYIAHNQNILTRESFLISDSITKELNANIIQTSLIRQTGRFCERYASDLLLTFSDLEAFLRDATYQGPKEWVIGVGIRNCGVDHNEFITARLQTSQTPYRYRKLLLLHIQDAPRENGDLFEGTRTFTLVDATYEPIRIS